MKNLFTTIVASASILLSPSIANAGNSFSDHVNLFNTLKEVGVTPLINSAHCKDGDYGLYHTTAQLLVVCQENRTANGDQVKWTLNDLDTLRHESHHVVQDCNNGKVGDGKRLSQLEHEGIDCQFKGWDTGKPKHILLAPSSPTVTFHVNGCSVEKWTEIATHQINQFLKGTEYEGLPIKFRNKPRPGNEFWNTDIKTDLQGAHALVTNMSLSAIDAILNMTPVFAHKRNIVSFIAGQHIGKIAKPLRPGHKTVNEWLKMVVDNQFKLSEIADGTAYEMLMQQPNNKLEPKQLQDQIK